MSNRTPLFSVSDEIELLALWRLVAEAKFQENPDDTDLWGSPYVHSLATRIAQAMLAFYVENEDFDAIERHKHWLASLPDNVILPVVTSKLRKDASTNWWSVQSQTAKISYVRGCVAPFEPSDEFIKKLITDAEA